MCSSTTQFQMNLANSILVVRFTQWLGETENLIDVYFCCTLVSGRLEEYFPPQIWCTLTTSPSILCPISPVYCLRSSLTVPLTSLDPVFSHLYWPWGNIRIPNSSDPMTYFDFNPSSSKRAIHYIVISCNWSCLIRASGLKGLVYCYLSLNPIFCHMNQ